MFFYKLQFGRNIIIFCDRNIHNISVILVLKFNSASCGHTVVTQHDVTPDCNSTFEPAGEPKQRLTTVTSQQFQLLLLILTSFKT